MKNASRPVIVAGLFVSALVWVALISVALPLLGGRAGAGNSTPVDDGSVKAKITSLDRGADFEINVSAHITDKAEQTLGGLTQHDIEVYEGSTRVDTQNFMPAGKGAIRLCLVGDYTATMRGRKIIEAQKAARALIRMLRDDSDYLGLYFFNDALYDHVPRRSEQLAVAPLTLLRREQAWDAIMTTPLASGTPMLKTMDLGLTGLSKVPGRRVMIVLTDGMDTGDEQDVEQEKKTLLARSAELHIPIYMINLISGEHANEAIMKELAQTSGGEYHAVAEYEKLQSIFERIGRSLQDDYTFTYKSPKPIEDGRKREVAVVVRSGHVGASAAGTYNVPGVIATGGDDAPEKSASLLTVFLSLGGLLTLLLAVPFVIGRRGGSTESVVTPPPQAVVVKQSAPTPAPAPRVGGSARPKAKAGLDAVPPGGASQSKQRHR